MSDDGFADDAFSSYSDFDDILYDADPSPDLADDLASHALHSPVYADDPGYELLEYHSDWDYYSDDYYDDDPLLLKNTPQDGSPPKSQKQAKRGKKRKLADLDDIPEIDLGERVKLRDCIRGTVWAKPAARRSNLYKSGQEPKVALLRDWQTRFGTTRVNQPVKSERPRLEKDESWANDMSLADMGLLTEWRCRVEQPTTTQATEEDQTQDDEPEEVYAESEPENALSDAAPEVKVVNADELEDNSEMLPLHPPKRSRRQKAILPSPPTSTESTAIDADQILNAPAETSSETTALARGHTHPSKSQLSELVGTSESQAVKASESIEVRGVLKNKKRRASASPPAEDEAQGVSARGTRLVASTRGKRLAFSTNSVTSDLKSRSTTETVAKTRSTRNKKV